LSDPAFIPDTSNTVYIIFMIIGIIGYFTIPTVTGWVIQAGGMGNYNRNVNQSAQKAGNLAGAGTGSVAGNISGQLFRKITRINQFKINEKWNLNFKEHRK